MNASVAVISDDESLLAEDSTSAVHPDDTANVIEIIEDEEEEFTDESVNDSAEYETEEEEEVTVQSTAESDEKDDDSSSSSDSDSSGPKVDIMPTIPENPDSPGASSSSHNTRGSKKSVVQIFGMVRISQDDGTLDDGHHLLLEGDKDVWAHSSEVEISEVEDDFEIEEEIEEIEEIEEEEVQEAEQIEHAEDEPNAGANVPILLSDENHAPEQPPGVIINVDGSIDGIFVDEIDESLLLEVTPKCAANETVDISNPDEPPLSDDLEYNLEQPDPLQDRQKASNTPVRPTQSTMAYKHRVFTFLLLFLSAMLGMALLLWLKRNDSASSLPEPSTMPTAAPASGNNPTSPTNPYRYEPVPDGVITGQDNSIIGASVAYDDSLLVAGIPSNSEVVWSYSADSQTGSFEEAEPNTGFGWSVDLVDSRYLAVGAPFLSVEGKTTKVGGAFVYRYDQRGKWEAVGSVLRGDEDLFAANENFGSSIAVAHLGNGRLRVVVGAPQNSQDWSTSTGRVYTFERDIDLVSGELLWDTMEQTPIAGDRADVRLGMSVGISKDGSVFLAGAPGSDFTVVPGYVLAYQYVASADDPWSLNFALRGDQPNEEFGASVALLSDSGDVIAVGAPGFDENSGRVVAYQRRSNGLYQQLGTDILGNSGDRIGEANALAGGVTENAQPFLLVATTSGLIRRYDYSPDSNEWEELYESLDTSLKQITSLASTGDDLAVGSAESNTVALFSQFSKLARIAVPFLIGKIIL